MTKRTNYTANTGEILEQDPALSYLPAWRSSIAAPNRETSAKNVTPLAVAMAQSPTFRVTLSPHFVADVAAIREAGPEGFAVWDARRRAGQRAGTAGKGKAWARWAEKLATGLDVAALVALVPEVDRDATWSLVMDSAASARRLSDQMAAVAAEREAAIAAAREREDARTRVLAA